MKTLSHWDVFAFLAYLQYNYWELFRVLNDDLEYRDNNRLVMTCWSKYLPISVYNDYKEIYNDWMKRNGIMIIECHEDFKPG